MKYTMFSEKENVLYINTNAITPRGVGFAEIKKVFKMPYLDRIEKYATSTAKQAILAEIKKHSGCKLSEYMNV